MSKEVSLTDAEEEMMRKWDELHNTLGGGAPGDQEAYAEMIKARDAFTEAANNYCAKRYEAKRGKEAE